VELVDLGVLFERQNEALARFDVYRGISFNCQFRHPPMIQVPDPIRCWKLE
jgi:hypothetical protein